MNTNRNLIITIVIMGIIIVALLLGRLSSTRYAYYPTSGNLLSASVTPLTTTGVSTGGVPQLHFGNGGSTYYSGTTYTSPTLYVNPRTPTTYYYSSTTTSPSYYSYTPGYSYTYYPTTNYQYTQDGCGPNGPYSTTTGAYCTY